MKRKMISTLAVLALCLSIIGCGGGGDDGGDDGLPPASFDITGTWSIDTVESGGCDEVPEYAYGIEAIISQSGNFVTIEYSTDDGTVSLGGLVSGSTIAISTATLPSSSGTVTLDSFTGTIDDTGMSFTATVTWTWTSDDGTLSCYGTTEMTAALYTSGSSGPVTPDVSGEWTGGWSSSEVEGLFGTFSLSVTQDISGDLTGSINVPLIIPDNSDLTGTISDNSMVFGDISSTIVFSGTVESAGNIAYGTYNYLNGFDIGTWSATKTPAAN